MINNIDFKIKNLQKTFNGEIIGDDNIKITGIGAIENAKNGDITFLSNHKYKKFLKTTNASVILVNNKSYTRNTNKTFLIVKDPYTCFAVLLSKVQKLEISNKCGIEHPSFISKSSRLDKDIYVGAFSYIGENVIIGKGAKILPNCFIGDNCIIGDNTTIYPGVKIYNKSIIGNKCNIHANSVIGSDGFGFAPSASGEYTLIPQIGNVIIKDNVSIGSNSVIDRATLESTIINKGVKIDNLVQIAHNVTIGNNTVIAALSGVAGSTNIGKNNMIGGQVGIIGHLNMGDNIKYAAQTGVTKDIKSNKTVIGFPAMEKEKYVKSYLIFKKLPSIENKLKILEEKLYNLQSK